MPSVSNIWFVIGLYFFSDWLGGFNFFYKRYRFGKFAGAIQRFEKRTNSFLELLRVFIFCFLAIT